MTWYVKAQDRGNGAAYSILCDDAAQVVSNYDDQVARGRDVWVEDHEGKKMGIAAFRPKSKAK